MSSAIATNPLSFNAWLTQVAALAIYEITTVAGVVQGVDPEFNAIIPSMLNYAEDRCARDLDLLASQTSLPYTLAAGNNQLAISPNDFVTVQNVVVNVNGAPTPLLPTTKEFLQYVYPSNSTNAPPQYFAMLGGDQATGGTTSNIILLGPPPDNNYPVTIVGTIRLPSLYQFANTGQAASQYTFLSTWYPELLLLASMIYVTMYQRNFSATSDDPQMGPNYENQYAQLLKGSIVEEQRKRFAAPAWASMGPTPIATATR